MSIANIVATATATASAPGFTQALLLLALGALIAGAIQFVVAYVAIWRRRHAVGKALLVEVHNCAGTARKHAHYIDEHLLENWAKNQDWMTNVMKKQYWRRIQAPLWEGALGTPELLPVVSLAKLVAFHNRAKGINHNAQAFQHEQDRAADLANRETPDKAQIASIVEALAGIAYKTARVCEDLANCESVKDLGDLPETYKEELAVFPPLVNKGGPAGTP